MIMEDIEAPHCLLLLRYFMNQGLVHKQSLFYTSPHASPQAFLGTLPNVALAKDSKSETDGSPKHTEMGKNLRIAWQYRKYFNENQSVENYRFQQSELGSSLRTTKSSSLSGGLAGNMYDFCSNFDLRKPMEKSMLNASKVECVSLQAISFLAVIKEKCSSFLSKFLRDQGGVSDVGRMAIQSLCEPQCRQSDMGKPGNPISKEELGRATWALLHTIGAQFPDKPTKQQKRDVKELMTILSRIYPCKECADHFKEVLKANPVEANSGVELVQWMCRVHNVVNRSLGKPTFPCQRVDARWGALECEEGACDLQGRRNTHV